MNDDVLKILKEQLKELLEDLLGDELNSTSQKKEIISPYMNKQEACKYIKKSNNTLDKLIKTQKFPVIKKGHSYFFDKNDIDNWMKS